MTIHDLLELMDCEIQSLLPRVEAQITSSREHFPDSQTWKAARNRLEWESRLKLDAACQHFSRAGSWPELSADETTFVHARLVEGREFLRLLQQPDDDFQFELVAPDRADRRVEDIAQFLLNEYWDWGGRFRWAARASAMT